MRASINSYPLIVPTLGTALAQHLHSRTFKWSIHQQIKLDHYFYFLKTPQSVAVMDIATACIKGLKNPTALLETLYNSTAVAILRTYTPPLPLLSQLFSANVSLFFFETQI